MEHANQPANNEENSVFKLIFYDFSFAFIDVCFSPDSKSLVVIPAKYPALIFMMTLPSVTHCAPPTATTTARGKKTETLLQITQKPKLVNYEARKISSLCIFGPARGVFGNTLVMSHLASNTNVLNQNTSDTYFHFVTWNDEGIGEYCLWRIDLATSNGKSMKFESFPKLVVPKLFDKVWMEVHCMAGSMTSI